MFDEFGLVSDPPPSPPNIQKTKHKQHSDSNPSSLFKNTILLVIVDHNL